MKTLQSGGHSSQSGEVCLLEAVSVLAGEVFSDHPESACPVLATFGRALNDAMPDDETRGLLLPLVPLLIGTRDAEKEQARAFIFADSAVRLFAPIALDAAGLTEQAQMLRNLPAIVGTKTARAAAWAASEAASTASTAASTASTATSEAARAARAARAASTATSEAARAARAASTAARAVIAESAAWAAWAASEAAEAAREANDWQVAVAVFREAIAL